MISWEENEEFPVKSHLSDGKLLMYMDGELPPNEAALVQEHLIACWLCRMNADCVQNAVFAFIKYRSESLRSLPAPSSDEKRFAMRLQNLSERLGKRSWLARLNDFLRQVLFAVRPATARPMVWAMTGLLIAFVSVAFFIWSDRIPVITASELLDKAIEAETREVGAMAQPVVYQKLRIRCGARAAVWELWHDKANSRFRQIVGSHTDRAMRESPESGEVALMSELMEVLRANRMNPQQPLSAASFQMWRQSLISKHEEISRSQKENSETITLRVSAVAKTVVGQIIEASLVVGGRNWRPQAQLLKVQGEKEIREYHLSEAAYDVNSLTTLNVFEEPAPMLTTMRMPVANSPGVNYLPTKAELQNAEVAAIYQLHHLKADLGEQIEILQESNEQVVVRGQVERVERKRELIERLKEIPFVITHIHTFGEVTTKTPTVRVRVTNSWSGSAAPVASVNLFDRHLARYLVDSREVAPVDTISINRRIEHMANRAFAEASAAMASCWALRRLVQRFNDDHEELLSMAAVSQLREVISDHLIEINTRNRNMRALLERPLIAIAGTLTCAPPPLQPAQVKRKEQVKELFKAVEQVQRLSYYLFDSGRTLATSPEDAACLMLQALAQLDAARIAVEQGGHK